MSLGSWGEGTDKESALGTMGRGKRGSSRLFPLPIDPRALSIIAAHVFLLGYPSRVSRVESSGRFVPGKIKHFERLGCSLRCFGFVVGS